MTNVSKRRVVIFYGPTIQESGLIETHNKKTVSLQSECRGPKLSPCNKPGIPSFIMTMICTKKALGGALDTATETYIVPIQHKIRKDLAADVLFGFNSFITQTANREFRYFSLHLFNKLTNEATPPLQRILTALMWSVPVHARF